MTHSHVAKRLIVELVDLLLLLEVRHRRIVEVEVIFLCGADATRVSARVCQCVSVVVGAQAGAGVCGVNAKV